MLLKRVMAVFVCIFAVACKSKPVTPPEELVAKVNGEIITLSAFDRGFGPFRDEVLQRHQDDPEGDE